MRAMPVADPGTPDIRSAWRFLAWLATRQRARLALGILWGCAWMVAQALIPAAIGAAIDALEARSASGFAVSCAVVLALGVAAAVTGLLRHRCVVGLFLDAAYRTIQLVTGQASRLGHSLARRVSAGEMVAIAAADVEALGDAVDITGRGSGAIAAMATVALVLLARSPELGLIVLVGAPAMTGLVGLLLRPLHHRQQGYRELQGSLAARAADIVSGLRVLRGIGGEATFGGHYRTESQALRRTGVHVARTESYLFGAEILLPGMFVTAATWLAAHYALRRMITPGELVSFYAYTSFLQLPLATLTESADKVVRGHVAAGRVIRVLSLGPDVTDPALPAAAPAAGASLRDPVSGLSVTAGQLTGLAAESPDEAAALADRLGRYAAARQPAATLGGVPLHDLAVATVRERILVARADAHLFAGQLAEQLGGSADRAAAALLAASAQDVADAVNNGRSGRLDARGRSLSGGQAQRLRLARALLADPEILILVDPTSAVDAHTEARIAAGLRESRKGRTTLVITTSPLLLDAADRVAYLAGGRVAAQGSHRDLLATHNGYAGAVTRGEDM